MGATTVLERVWDAVRETLDEFQMGPDRPRRVKKKLRPQKRPRWMDVRDRRIPQKNPKTRDRMPPPEIPIA